VIEEKKKPGRPRKVSETGPNDPNAIFANGACFGVIQLEIDLMPKPSAQRIVQLVNYNGRLVQYVSENAYHRSELIDIFDKLYRASYQQSISKGAVALLPIKGRLHWKLFTVDFCKTGKGDRVNPETGETENEGLDVN